VKERFRIHHAVGSRVILDSYRDPIRFEYREAGAGSFFSIFTDKTPAIEEILRLKDEINVFIFKESEGVAVEKLWFYTGDNDITYKEDEKCLTIVASSKIVYKPGDFEIE
jgi:hypothetical protein